jgi:SAM-dependent methyltransferase
MWDYFLNKYAKETKGADFSERPGVIHGTNVIMDWLNRKGIFDNVENVLDIGCGSGAVCQSFLKMGKKVCGVTIEDKGVKSCKSLGVKVLKEDMHFLPFKDDSFDLIWASHVLEHSIAPLFALCEWKRILKTTKYLVIWVPFGVDYKGKDDGCAVYGCKGHFFTLTEWQYKWLFEIVGLKLLEETMVGYDLPPVKPNRRCGVFLLTKEGKSNDHESCF